VQHKYNIDAVDQCLRDLLEVSDHLYLIALKLTYYLEQSFIWWNHNSIWRDFHQTLPYYTGSHEILILTRDHILVINV